MAPMYLWMTLTALFGGSCSQQLDQAVQGDQLIGPHQQHREYRALLVGAKIQLSRAAPGPHRAEQAESNIH
jgi:hypothetical protein